MLITDARSTAKNTEGQWYVSAGTAYHTTQDTARNNAASGNDPRPDDFASREMSIEDSLSYSVTLGYGIARRLNLQLDVGWFRGEVGPIDAYLTDTFPIGTDPAQPFNLNFSQDRETTIPVGAGRLTEIPVALSSVLRFRTDKALNPYLVVGLGMLFTEVSDLQEVDALNARLSRLRIRSVHDSNNKEITPESLKPLKGEGRVPMTFPVSVRVGDSFEWHLGAGAEHFFGDRISLVAEARYQFTNQEILVELAGEEQVRFFTFSEELFRPDGSTRLFNDSAVPPNPFVDPNDLTKGRVRCTLGTTGDFDNDGRNGDLCYRNDGATSLDDPDGSFLVQGGRINLSGFTLHVGMRFYF